MKCKLHYVKFRPSSSKHAAHLRKAKIADAMYRPFEAETIELVGSAAQKLWDEILKEGKEVDFRRVEICALDWQPALS